MDATTISTTEAAQILGISSMSVRRYVDQGILVGYRVGPKLIRVNAESVANILTPATVD
jgi:excisionase family DNA binding protein